MAKCMLNEDIWHHVLNFIPTEDLERINSCHPVLYEAWMKSRYATLEILKRDKETKRLVSHLWCVLLYVHVNLPFNIILSQRPECRQARQKGRNSSLAGPASNEIASQSHREPDRPIPRTAGSVLHEEKSRPTSSEAVKQGRHQD